MECKMDFFSVFKVIMVTVVMVMVADYGDGCD